MDPQTRCLVSPSEIPVSTNPQIRRVSENWDNFWSSLEAPMVRLYTSGRPKTIHQFWQRCYAEDLWALMGDRAKDARYLELGAGRGTTSMYLASKGCDVTMVDLSSTGFEVAKSNFAREGVKLPTMVQADARNTGLPSESYDCILSIGLLEHFEDPRPVLAESARLLRPGGLHFAVVIPERPDSIRHLAYALLRPWSFGWALLPTALKRLIRPARHSGPQEKNTVVRTKYTCADYLKMLDGLEVADVHCVPYNSYHPVYNSSFMEANLAIPLYRAHRMVKKIVSGPPLLTTWPGIASCDLLTFRKPGEKHR